MLVWAAPDDEVNLIESLPEERRERVLALVAIIAFLWKGNPMLGLILAMAMVINLFVASLAGTLIPLVLKQLNLDPALGSGVVVTTFTDVFGFLSFLGLATIFLRYLI